METVIGVNQIFKTKQRTIIQNVADLCALYPEVKGSYLLLFKRYLWLYCGLNLYIPYERLHELPSPESITRAFRKLKEKGGVQETLKTAERRAEYQELYRVNINKV
jgi:hypothetical protein